MVTFNVDSLDFVDDEEARFGADSDFAARFDSANSRLELEDLTAGAVGYIPQNVSTDLVGGKFAETVSEGKALADDGNVYDSIQEGVDNASSWVKVGPGTFLNSTQITKQGLTLIGSGNRTHIESVSNGNVITVEADDVTIANIQISSGQTEKAIHFTADGLSVANCYIHDTQLVVNGDVNDRSGTTVRNCVFERTRRLNMENNSIVINNHFKDSIDNSRFYNDAGGTGNSIIAYNVIENTPDGIHVTASGDNIVYANSLRDIEDTGIKAGSNDNIVVKNQISNAGTSIDDSGSDNVIENNLTT